MSSSIYGEIVFSKQGTTQASINYEAYGSGSALDIESSSRVSVKSTNGIVDIHGESAVGISSGDEIFLDGNVYIDIDSSPSSTQYQSLTYLPYTSGSAPLQDFSWDYDYDTGCINRLYGFDRVGVWW